MWITESYKSSLLPSSQHDCDTGPVSQGTYFTTIDMVSGYHQIEVASEDRHKLLLSHRFFFCLFQYCRLPFGLAVAPGTFRAVIEDMLQVLDAEDVMAYMNVVICFHSTFEEHLKGIEKLLLTIRNRNSSYQAKSVSLPQGQSNPLVMSLIKMVLGLNHLL